MHGYTEAGKRLPALNGDLLRFSMAAIAKGIEI
jgi:hypothetical protein